MKLLYSTRILNILKTGNLDIVIIFRSDNSYCIIRNIISYFLCISCHNHKKWLEPIYLFIYITLSLSSIIESICKYRIIKGSQAWQTEADHNFLWNMVNFLQYTTVVDWIYLWHTDYLIINIWMNKHNIQVFELCKCKNYMGISEWKVEVHFMFEHDNGKTCLFRQLIHENFIEYLVFKAAIWWGKMALLTENDSDPSNSLAQ